MTAPEARPGGLDSNVRGLLVLGAAVVVGILLLASWGDDGGSTVETTDSKTSTTVDTSGLGSTTSPPDEEVTTTTAPPSDHSPSEVSVIVLNGSGQTGAAGTNSETVGAAGYTMLTPGNAPANIDSTTVYYADEYESDAIAVAQLLGKGTDAVKPLSEASLGGAEGDADVVVILGADTPPVDSSTTTTTTG
ncbi:LytR C-terminal domain-containing protein [Aquihabitans daechungensis]|uniref:LytR C-terminal domain-containing protein n=1 Tax=Aquihabitans daechungensis TaxID=1052257 RepID=UPI003BA39D5E